MDNAQLDDIGVIKEEPAGDWCLGLRQEGQQHKAEEQEEEVGRSRIYSPYGQQPQGPEGYGVHGCRVTYLLATVACSATGMLRRSDHLLLRTSTLYFNLPKRRKEALW